MDKITILNSQEQRQVFFRLLKYVKPHIKQIIIAFVLLSLVTIGEVSGPILIKIFIDDFVAPNNIVAGPIITLASLYLFILFTSAVVMYIQSLKFQEIALKIIQQLRIDVFSKVQTLGLRYFDKTPVGTIVSRVTNDTEAIKELFVSVLAIFIQSIFLFIGIFVAMFILDIKLAALCLLFLPILIWIIHMYRKLSSTSFSALRELIGQLNAKLNESLQGMSIIQVFRQEKRMRKEFNELNTKHYEAGIHNIKINGLLLRPAVDLVHIIAILIVLSFFGITSMESTIEIGVLYAFVNYISRFFEPVNQVMQQLTFFQQAVISAARVFKLLDEKELAPQQENRPVQISKGKIEFRNVTFSYDGNQKVLKNITFTANPGDTVALVGHTGSGKSSIINLLMRFYEFEKGEILIDGVSIKQYNMNELRQKMGLVLQDAFLFYGTIKDNIRLHNEELTDEDIIEAAEFVQANQFIEKLPDGYNQQVTERGSTFSSGQRQLLAFARTMVTNPKILILDEATANIDTETEEMIQQALAKMRKGRTTIAIAHRLSTIQDADLILVLHKGEIVERGNHQQLLAQKGLYYKMYLLQNGHSENIADVVQQEI
ncbi:ABC transporter transmembrane domain-containing protein [Caldibacillus thermolactis]|jgi:ATP-binding cassette, subfamily B, multidrug efflux pump|uniref:ABC transporter transmembrane domain-containing protein n=1 Tax=Pallidibacillus thermolactis TaxID=251051 RepID=A0ABT2WIS0_9BACI|nr:ABC transporter transmembrane domain-containing protein [Pallidibacillus thermolactis]MCU9595560.1 ABC transporter transmembrane domain-containing protein [Pallidibacillus thermolactis]MCU9600758.1 ABC transporter transmembrane domain-containing protein [Pallidibacillus thermolactis subsp. kokeshiiformis]MED1674246.1 ABC transporter transmembrane domain-containing protein [Pallidibacillus thermolactis subsp. kokeshiiformis]